MSCICPLAKTYVRIMRYSTSTTTTTTTNIGEQDIKITDTDNINKQWPY